LERNGLHPSDIRPFHRVVHTPQGPQTMRARSLSFPWGSNPEALLQIAQHETPELVLQPRYMQHPNGAISITEVIVCVQDPDAVANKYGLYAGREPQKRGDLCVVDLGQSRITVVSPENLPGVLPGEIVPTIPFLAGFAVSSNLDTTKRVLEDRGVEFQSHDGRILVGAADGYGASVLFEDVNK
jgi:Glyoxalase-like domain